MRISGVLVPLVLAAALALAPAHFPARPGWHVGAARIDARSVVSWAATVRWRDCAGCLPHRTLERLPRGGIAVQLFLSDTKGPRWVKPMRWPPRLRPITSLEGLPRRVGVVQRLGRLRGLEAYLFVFFGRPQPTARQLARARVELAGARLP